LQDKNNKYSNSLVRKKNSERKKKPQPTLHVKWSVPNTRLSLASLADTFRTNTSGSFSPYKNTPIFFTSLSSLIITLGRLLSTVTPFFLHTTIHVFLATLNTFYCSKRHKDKKQVKQLRHG
jgi:hypothetical protein